ncbi:MAG: helix-turn-helix domain-containing protein [Sphingomonas sp.]|jgi:transcriptional regulator with XRE-family HTH domain
MTEPESGEEATLFPKTAGEKLREARVAQNLSLADIAARTRVPIRHLEAIERSDYTGLPSPTYSVGFAKAYARAIGADEVAIGREVRGDAGSVPRTPEFESYDIAGPSRLPSNGLAIGLGVLAALVVIGFAVWYGTDWFHGASISTATPQQEATETAPASTPEAAPAPAVAPTAGQVTLAATDIVWLRVYDATGKTLFQGEMKPGDRYDVPPDANRPMINVGRPDKLTVTVNGSIVPPLGTGKVAIKDVDISAAALTARAQGQAVTGPTPNAAIASPLAAPGADAGTGTGTGTGAATPAKRDAAKPAAPRPTRPAKPGSSLELPLPGGNGSQPSGAGGAPGGELQLSLDN